MEAQLVENEEALILQGLVLVLCLAQPTRLASHLLFTQTFLPPHLLLASPHHHAAVGDASLNKRPWRGSNLAYALAHFHMAVSHVASRFTQAPAAAAAAAAAATTTTPTATGEDEACLPPPALLPPALPFLLSEATSDRRKEEQLLLCVTLSFQHLCLYLVYLFHPCVRVCGCGCVCVCGWVWVGVGV